MLCLLVIPGLCNVIHFHLPSLPLPLPSLPLPLPSLPPPLPQLSNVPVVGSCSTRTRLVSGISRTKQDLSQAFFWSLDGYSSSWCLAGSSCWPSCWLWFWFCVHTASTSSAQDDVQSTTRMTSVCVCVCVCVCV